jgi:hypothetical protein
VLRVGESSGSFSENLLIAVAAGALGICLAMEIPQVFRKLVPQIPYFPFDLDWHIFWYLATVPLASSIVVGLAPAPVSLKQDVWPTSTPHKLRESPGQCAICWWSYRFVSASCYGRVVLVFAGCAFDFVMEPDFETRHVLAVPLQFSDTYTAS